MIGIGIDTGGTCTDAVIYDMDAGEVLARAKTETTHQDLKIGIGKAVDALPQELLKKAGQIALSTTLATNACVEGKGGHGKLILIGVHERVFLETHADYGIEEASDVLRIPCRILPQAEDCEEPDWESVRKALPAFLSDCDCVSIVQLYSADHQGAYEKQTESIIREISDIPVILGNSLFPDRNAIRRGAGALLNARLIPVLYEFQQAIREVFLLRGIDLPITIIRSDGSQMSERFAAKRPVETLLCGPAASVIGAQTLADTEDALVVDIGGTTTDVAIIRGGLPERASDGILVGRWKTFVKGLFIDTFGLGGDSAIHYLQGDGIYLEERRVIPLSMLASAHPAVRERLKRLAELGRAHPYYLHEFFVLVRDPSPNASYTDEETALIAALREGPLSFEQAAEAMDRDIYSMRTERLETDGLILRAGLTPTDIMHLCGDFDAYDAEAAEYAARFVARSAGFADTKALCEAVYEAVVKKLYDNLCRIMIRLEILDQKAEPSEIEAMIEANYRLATDREAAEKAFFAPSFSLRAKLIGVGAPTHVFLPRVAKLLNTEAIIPKDAAVANAVGAIAGQVVAVVHLSIAPETDDVRYDYRVQSPDGSRGFASYEEARVYAEDTAAALAKARAKEQGAAGEISVIREIKKRSARTDGGSIWLSDELTVTASGHPKL